MNHDKVVRLTDQNETIQIRFSTGAMTVHEVLDDPPRYCEKASKNIDKRQFQTKPTMFPADNNNSLRASAPSKGKVSDTKKKLKITRMKADSLRI